MEAERPGEAQSEQTNAKGMSADNGAAEAIQSNDAQLGSQEPGSQTQKHEGEGGTEGEGGGEKAGESKMQFPTSAKVTEQPPPEQSRPKPWASRSVTNFDKLDQIGEGTYGWVHRAQDKNTGELVALKKVRLDNEKEGFPVTAIREIKILSLLSHENVVNLKEIVTSHKEKSKSPDPQAKTSIYMVFEYMDHDLSGLVDRPGQRFSVGEVKCYMKQLLNALNYLHNNDVLHRDLKLSNILVNNRGNLKLADFGLARGYRKKPGKREDESSGHMTNHVVTLWYRPPELLLGAQHYGPEVDIWSTGCIFAELLISKPLLPGKVEAEQLERIWNTCGSPTEESWPGVSKLKHYNLMKPEQPLPNRIHERLAGQSQETVDIIKEMLCLNPSQRLSAKDALKHNCFWSDPKPLRPEDIPKRSEACHELTAKRRRQERQMQGADAKRQATGR